MTDKNLKKHIGKFTLVDFVNLIDRKFSEFCGKIDRLDIAWGTWSVIMNEEIRKRIQEDDPQSGDLSLIYNYWIGMSQLLSLCYQHEKAFWKFVLKGKIRKKADEILELRGYIPV